MKLLYKDAHIAVVIKDAGELSQSDKNGEESLVEKLSDVLGCVVYPVHRLDRPVGGVMVYALNKNSASKLSEQLRADGVGFSKEYTAFVSGSPEKSEGTLNDYIYKDGLKNKSFVCSSERKGVKFCSLDYKVKRAFEHQSHGLITVVSVKLHTGRTHQIRVQFSSRGLPILGDGKYGSRIKLSGKIALWSGKLEFTHPENGKKCVFEEESPDFLTV